MIVMCAFVSPYGKNRDAIRSSVEKGEFIEVYVSTPIEICKERDTKGLYKKAREGSLDGFTGINSPYEPPLYAEAAVDASVLSVDACTSRILNLTLCGET